MTRTVTHSFNDSKKPEFTQAQREQLDLRREYITKLRELGTKIAAEFPEDKQITARVSQEIAQHAAKIAELEMVKIQSELKGELKK